MTLFNDGDSDFQGAPVGSADEPGLPVQAETDQCCQTDQGMGTWRPTGKFLCYRDVLCCWKEEISFIVVI